MFHVSLWTCHTLCVLGTLVAHINVTCQTEDMYTLSILGIKKSSAESKVADVVYHFKQAAYRLGG